MYALQQLNNYLQQTASPDTRQHLGEFIDALKAEREFPLTRLFEVDYNAFEMAVEVLREWRIDRYYAGDPARLEGWLPEGRA